MNVRAKVAVTGMQDYFHPTTGEIQSRQVTLSAVYSNDPNSANYSWSKWTPSGQVTLQITNPDAYSQFQPGKEYFVDFTEAPKS